ncbi:MAG: hypothetical protein COT67_02040 [Candidatus Tagabacteria bacterium CG09_land_8_20_14_0_10_41_14]|uniref:LTD domain-containing protein n=1 Tax=Candidatus Tagabacteria bacterium CG09_land_8_20_14_0_10_41_14 TaxID=1975021 RepID=A0A2H0WL27_9BACT|nr:MAG: hypothetical protein COT67_02040 [Candidatus Tagabacteria bacterium CG09_land_8_20_14_0_10_41_14]
MVEFEDIRKPGRDFGFLILFLIIIGVLWYAQGGSSRFPSSPFLDNNSVIVPNVSNDVDDDVDNDNGGTDNGALVPATSPEADRVSLKIGKAKEIDPRKEYVEIKIERNNDKPVDITGWRLESSVSRAGFEIPYAVLRPGDTAIVSTGESPISVSFHVNVCSGYFTQHKEFYPSLSKKCLWPKDEEWPASLSFECLDYIDTLPRCTANITHPFSLQDNDCIMAINSRLSYNGCVEAHKNDENFFEDEWRIYLGRSSELWRQSHETIVLKDLDGRVVDSLSY